MRLAVETRLRSGYLKDPKVSVEVVAYRPFYVHGEVRSGGEVAFKNGVTIRDAIAISGGYTYRANQSYVLLIREGTAQEVRVDLPSTDIVMPGRQYPRSRDGFSEPEVQENEQAELRRIPQ